MDDQGFESDPPAAYETRQPIFIGSSRRGKFIAAAISAIAIISGAMLLAVTLIPTETMPLCKFDFKSGARLDVGILGFCSSKTKEGELVCNQQIGMKLDDTELSKSDKDVLNDVLVTELTYVFILHPVSGGLAIFSVMLSVLGHFFKTSCFVFFGEGNIVAFAAITAAGIAGLASFGIELAFLLYANSHLQGPDMNLNVASIVLSLAGGVLSFTAFVLAFLHFNRSYSSGVVDQLGHNEDGHSEQTETDFWTDGERAERNERMLHAQEQAEKKAYESIRANDLKSMNNFLARGQQPTVYEAPLPELPKTPRNPYSGPAPGDHWTQTPRTLKKSSKKYSKTWDRPTSRFDETPLPPRPQSGNVRSIPKAKRRDTQDKLEELEAQDEVKPLDLYQAKPPRKGFKAPPPAPTSSRYSQNTGYLQSVAPTATDVSLMPPVAEAKAKANAVFEQQAKKHQSIAPSSVYSQM